MHTFLDNLLLEAEMAAARGEIIPFRTMVSIRQNIEELVVAHTLLQLKLQLSFSSSS